MFRNKIALVVAGVAGAAALTFGGPALAAPAVHAVPPPASVYRWQDTNSGQCIYDRGLNQVMQLGGCTSAARFTRSHCGNRLSAYYCEYTDGSGNAMTSVGVYVEAGHPIAADTQLFSDPPLVTNLYLAENGYQYYMAGLGGSVVMEPSGDRWALISG